MKAFVNYTINTLIALAILVVMQFVYIQVQSIYYTYAPIDTFYKLDYFKAKDVCIGDVVQTVESKRYIYHTDVGYPGEVIREMFLFKDGVAIKTYEDSGIPFVEVRIDGVTTRQQQLPPNLEEGQYQWVMYLTLDVHGVKRTDIPPIQSNVFNIKQCHE